MNKNGVNFCYFLEPKQLNLEAYDTPGHTNHVKPHTCRLKEAMGLEDSRCVASRYINEHPVMEYDEYEVGCAERCPDFAIDEKSARERVSRLIEAYDKILGKN